MSRDLEQIIEDFDAFRVSFGDFRKREEIKADTLVEFEARLVDLRADLRPHRKNVAAEWQKRDDKAATAIKFRLAIAIHNGTLKDEEGHLLYDQCSINQAEKFASGTNLYQEFLDQRVFWKESLTNVTDLRNDIDGYINLIKDMLKTL